MIGLDLKIKVCGMKHQQNVDELIGLGVDYLGNIFFDKSPRSISQTGVKLTVNPAKKVGVFVKESIDVIKENNDVICTLNDFMRSKTQKTASHIDQIKEHNGEQENANSDLQIFSIL